MKRKSRKTHNILALDLFGEIPVTWDEVEFWCKTVTHGRFCGDRRNYLEYVRGYAVVEKIKAAKALYANLDRYFEAANDSTY